MDVNDQLAKMCREAKLDFITHKNINPRADLNKSRIHLTRNGLDKIGWNITNEDTRNIKWGHNWVKSSYVPSTPAKSQVYKSETIDLNTTQKTNQNLRYLCIKN